MNIVEPALRPHLMTPSCQTCRATQPPAPWTPAGQVPWILLALIRSAQCPPLSVENVPELNQASPGTHFSLHLLILTHILSLVCGFLLPSSGCFRDSLGDVGTQGNKAFLEEPGAGDRSTGVLRRVYRHFSNSAFLLCHHTGCTHPAVMTVFVLLRESQRVSGCAAWNLPSHLFPGILLAGGSAKLHQVHR